MGTGRGWVYQPGQGIGTSSCRVLGYAPESKASARISRTAFSTPTRLTLGMFRPPARVGETSPGGLGRGEGRKGPHLPEGSGTDRRLGYHRGGHPPPVWRHGDIRLTAV